MSFTNRIISNDPADAGLDLNPKSRQPPPARKGRRAIMLFTVFGVGIGGAFLAESWWKGQKGQEVKAAPPVRPMQAQLPDIRPAEPEEPPPPPRETAAPPPAAPAPAQPGRPQGSNGFGTITFASSVPEPPPGFMVDGTVPVQGRGCSLGAGAKIMANLENLVRSEVAGGVTARVRETVYDTDGYGIPLIPAGSLLYGTYKPTGLAFNSTRVPFLWETIRFPPGWPQQHAILPSAAGMDAAGSMGVGGDVRTHWWDVIAAAGVFTFVNAIQRSAVNGDNSFAYNVQRSASQEMGGLAEDVVRQRLQLEPEITIPSGTPIVVQIGARPVKISDRCYD